MPSLLEGLPDRSNGSIERSPDAKRLANRPGLVSLKSYPEYKPYSVCLDTVPVTVERRPYIPEAKDRLQDPGTARVNIAASNEAPHGTTKDDWAHKHSRETVLQQHCAYWDRDGDGVIWPRDTYEGVRAWGWNVLLSLVATFIISLGLSYMTCPSFMVRRLYLFMP